MFEKDHLFSYEPASFFRRGLLPFYSEGDDGGDGGSDGGGGGGGSDEAGSAGTGDDTGGSSFIGDGGVFTEGWRGQLQGDLKDSTAFEGMNSVDDLLNHAHNQHKLIGKKTLAPINENSTEPEIAAFKEAVGAATDLEGYGLKAPENLREGETFNAEYANSAAGIALKYHIPTAAMQELAVLQRSVTHSQMDAWAKDGTEAAAAREIALKDQYKENYDFAMKASDDAAATFGLLEVLQAAGIDRDPKIVDGLNKVYGSMSEGTLKGHATTEALGTVQDQIDEVKQDPAWTDKEHKDHKAVQKKYDALTKKLAAMKTQDSSS